MEQTAEELAGAARLAALLPRVRRSADFYSAEDSRGPRTLSLLCPVSLARQAVPVRTRACAHLGTIDLASLLRASAQRETAPRPSQEFACPVCHCSGQLYVDEVLAGAVADLPSNVTSVAMFETGEVVANPAAKFAADLELLDSNVHEVQDGVFNNGLVLPQLKVRACSPAKATFSLPAGLGTPKSPKTFTFDTLARSPVGKAGQWLQAAARSPGVVSSPSRAGKAKAFGERCLDMVGSRWVPGQLALPC
jgi:hypothetical protein